MGTSLNLGSLVYPRNFCDIKRQFLFARVDEENWQILVISILAVKLAC